MPARRPRTPPPLAVRHHAACRANPAGHDAPTAKNPAAAEHIARAVSICRNCCAFTECKTWSDTMPRNTFHGIVGGRLHRTGQ